MMEKTNFVDIHNSKTKYSDCKRKIQESDENPSKKILLEYIVWHDKQIEAGRIEHSSAKRSLEIAYKLCRAFPDIQNAKAEQLEKWFATEVNRFKEQRTGGETIKITDEKISAGTIQKTERQVSKFLKFADFLTHNKPIEFFSTAWALPIKAKFLHIDTSVRKRVEKPRISQEQIKQLIEKLKDNPKRYSQGTAVMVAILNDCGARFSEILTLRNEDIVSEGEFLRISITQSKTATRQNLLLLSKPIVLNWLSQSPTRHDKKGFVFCNSKGKLISYARMRIVLKKALDELKFSWKDNSSFHFLRHLWASRSFEWSDALRCYWLGWSQKNEMLNTYGEFSVEQCKEPFLRMIEKEHNPMLDSCMSIVHEQERHSQKQALLAELGPMVEKYLATHSKAL